MKNILVLIILSLIMIACEGNKDGSAELGQQPSDEVIDVPEPEDEPIVYLDHAHRDPAFASLPTEEECLRLQDWQDNDFEYTFYFKYSSSPGGGFLRFDEDGVVRVSGTPANPMGTHFISDDVVIFGDCTIHVVTSLVGIDFVEWD